MAHLCIIQWREPFDDEDCLDIFAYPDSDSAYPLADIREACDIPLPENEDAVDEEGCIIITNELTINDGQGFEHNGRKFLVSITEVK